MKKMYLPIIAPNAELIDAEIEKFLIADPERKQIEVRHFCAIKTKPMATPMGINLPSGMQQVQTEMIYHSILVFAPGTKDLAKHNQKIES